MIIQVTDTNDEYPRFLGLDENGWLNLNLLEGDYTNIQLPGKLVDTLNAVDEDGTSPNNQVCIQMVLCSCFKDCLSSFICLIKKTLWSKY